MNDRNIIKEYVKSMLSSVSGSSERGRRESGSTSNQQRERSPLRLGAEEPTALNEIPWHTAFIESPSKHECNARNPVDFSLPQLPRVYIHERKEENNGKSSSYRTKYKNHSQNQDSASQTKNDTYQNTYSSSHLRHNYEFLGKNSSSPWKTSYLKTGKIKDAFDRQGKQRRAISYSGGASSTSLHYHRVKSDVCDVTGLDKKMIKTYGHDNISSQRRCYDSSNHPSEEEDAPKYVGESSEYNFTTKKRNKRDSSLLDVHQTPNPFAAWKEVEPPVFTETSEDKSKVRRKHKAEGVSLLAVHRQPTTYVSSKEDEVNFVRDGHGNMSEVRRKHKNEDTSSPDVQKKSTSNALWEEDAPRVIENTPEDMFEVGRKHKPKVEFAQAEVLYAPSAEIHPFWKELAQRTVTVDAKPSKEVQLVEKSRELALASAAWNRRRSSSSMHKIITKTEKAESDSEKDDNSRHMKRKASTNRTADNLPRPSTTLQGVFQRMEDSRAMDEKNSRSQKKKDTSTRPVVAHQSTTIAHQGELPRRIEGRETGKQKNWWRLKKKDISSRPVVGYPSTHPAFQDVPQMAEESIETQHRRKKKGSTCLPIVSESFSKSHQLYSEEPFEMEFIERRWREHRERRNSQNSAEDQENVGRPASSLAHLLPKRHVDRQKGKETRKDQKGKNVKKKPIVSYPIVHRSESENTNQLQDPSRHAKTYEIEENKAKKETRTETGGPIVSRVDGPVYQGKSKRSKAFQQNSFPLRNSFGLSANSKHASSHLQKHLDGGEWAAIRMHEHHLHQNSYTQTVKNTAEQRAVNLHIQDTSDSKERLREGILDYAGRSNLFQPTSRTNKGETNVNREITDILPNEMILRVENGTIQPPAIQDCQNDTVDLLQIDRYRDIPVNFKKKKPFTILKTQSPTNEKR